MIERGAQGGVELEEGFRGHKEEWS